MGLVLQNEDKIYIHSNKTKLENLYRGLDPEQINKKIAQLNLQTSIINRYKNVLSLDGKIVEDMNDIEALNEALEGLAEGWNRAVEEQAGRTGIFKDVQQLVNDKSILAARAANKIKYANKEQAYKELDNIFANIGKIYQKLYGMDQTTLMWCLQNSPNLKNSLGNSALGKYISEVSSNVEGQVVSVTPEQMKIAEDLGKSILHLSAQEKDGKIGITRPKIATVKGRLTDLFHKKSGEEAVGFVMEGLLQDVVANTIDPIMYHTGSETIKAVPGQEFLSTGKKMPAIRADNYSDYLEMSTTIDDTTHTISGYIGLSDKWEREYNGQIGVLWRNKSFHQKNISILDSSPVVRYIDDLSLTLKDANIYSNAYFHNEDEIIEAVEKDATLAGLTGSGGQFSLNGKRLFDISSFIVINGKFYSTLNIFLHMLRQQNWKSHLIIKYTNRVDSTTNTWEEPAERNLLAAQRRSDRMLKALQKMKITISLNPELLKFYSH